MFVNYKTGNPNAVCLVCLCTVCVCVYIGSQPGCGPWPGCGVMIQVGGHGQSGGGVVQVWTEAHMNATGFFQPLAAPRWPATRPSKNVFLNVAKNIRGLKVFLIPQKRFGSCHFYLAVQSPF